MVCFALKFDRTTSIGARIQSSFGVSLLPHFQTVDWRNIPITRIDLGDGGFERYGLFSRVTVEVFLIRN